MNPLVSIILPTYNGARTISRAIASVISQSYENWELFIICDGSADDTSAVVEGFLRADTRIIFISQKENKGIQKTLNEGLARVRGEYIARIDDDDEWIDTEKIAEQVNFLEKNPDHVLLGTDSIVVSENGELLSINSMPKTDTAIRSAMLSKNCFSHSTIMIRKAVAMKVGGYSEQQQALHAEDYDLWLKAGLEGKMANLAMQSTALTVRLQGLTSRNRVMQARHIFSCMRAYTKKYPHAFKGYVFAIGRIVFFSAVALVPLPYRFLYKLQRLYRSV